MATTAASTTTPISTTAANFLTHLFDPSIVDQPSPAKSPPPILNNGVGATATSINATGGGHGHDSNTNTAEFDQDVYYVLVIVTVGLTLFVLVVFSVYRVVEACFEKNNEQSESAAAVQSQSAAGAQEGVMSPRLERVRTTSAAGTSGEQSQLRTGERTSSVEFLTSFFSNFSRPAPTTILPVSGHAPPNLRARPHKRRGADNPPPYDDPPPYHIAISMSEALGSSDLEEDSIELEEDAIASEAVKAEEVVPSIPERPGVVV